MSNELKEAAQQALKELGEARKIVRASSSRQLAKDWDRRATDALANLRAALQQAEAQQPATAIACGIPGMVKTTCPYCEQGFAFEHEQPAAPEPVLDVRCEGCGYMTHHREHIGCVRAAKQHTHPATGEPVGYMNEGHIHELAMRRIPYGYVYPEAGAGASTAVYTHPAPSMPATPEPVGVNQLRKELSDANDFIQSLADLCVKYETLLGYRKTKAPEGASELAEARGESNVNTELDLAMPDSICDHVFVLDPKSSIRICNKCGTVECKKHTHPAPSVPATTEPVLFIHPDTFAMNNAHVGAWKPGHELTSYIPLYTHPAPSVPDDDFDLICSAIDKADTITMEGDYMLDSDDCIAVVRVMQVLLSVRAAMLAAKDA